MKKTHVDFCFLKKPRLPTKLTKKVHLVFNADCDELPFTIFPEMPGYKILMDMISLNIDTTKCEIKWKFHNDRYNRCEGIIFDKDFIKFINIRKRIFNGKNYIHYVG